MVIVEDFSKADTRLVMAGLVRRKLTAIRFAPYFTAEELNLDPNTYLCNCLEEFVVIATRILFGMEDCGVRMDTSQIDVMMEWNVQNVNLENLTKILNRISKYDAHYIFATYLYETEAIAGAADKMAEKIVDQYRDRFISIGHRTGKLIRTSDGGYQFKKKGSKKYGFTITPQQICEEYVINHSNFKGGKGNGAAVTDLRQVSSWR